MLLPSVILVQATTTSYNQNQRNYSSILNKNSLSTSTSNFSSMNVSLDYSTYMGGSSNDYGYAIAVDSSGDSYITGMTISNDFPVKNAFQSTLNNSGSYSDIILAKFNPAGKLIFSTYFGGSRDDVASAIAVDSTGNCYITGYTFSSNFPTKNAYNSTFGDGVNVFLAKFNATGQLVFRIYFGGTGSASGIALGPSRNIFITGETTCCKTTLYWVWILNKI